MSWDTAAIISLQQALGVASRCLWRRLIRWLVWSLLDRAGEHRTVSGRTSSGRMQRPWIAGSKELLENAVGHFGLDEAFDPHLAFVSIDNAVELTGE